VTDPEQLLAPVDRGAVDLRGRLASAAGLFVALDFDGTLAPISSDPDEPMLTPANRNALERLVDRPDAAVAVVSGRALDDLRDRIDVDQVTLSGNHGLELYRDQERTVHPAALEHRPSIVATADLLEDALASVPGAVVEDKELTVTVHYRQTPGHRIETVRSAVERAVEAADDDLRIVDGKQVFEVRPAVERDKGTVVSELATSYPDDWRSVSIGDDTTDEDAFRVVAPDGIAIRVGDTRETAATHRLPKQEAVAPVLRWLATDVLDGRIDGTDSAE